MPNPSCFKQGDGGISKAGLSPGVPDCLLLRILLKVGVLKESESIFVDRLRFDKFFSFPRFIFVLKIVGNSSGRNLNYS